MSGTEAEQTVISRTGIAAKHWVPVLAFCVLVTLPGLWFALRDGDRDAVLTMFIVTASVLVIVGGVCMMRVVLHAGDQGLHARCMGVFRWDFRWEEITAVEPGPETGLMAGMGVRLLSGGVKGLLVGGPTVRLRSAGKDYLLSAKDPEAVAAEIRRRLP